jgi:hypothetical protein
MTPSPNSNTGSSVPVKLLDRKHPEWLEMHDMWDAVDLLYEGGVKLKNNGQVFLLKRPKELYDVYQERQRRLTYQNLIGNCVGAYLAKLFSREPKIDGKTADERFAAFLQDCDRAGTTFLKFSRSIVESMMLYRRTFVLTDKPQPGDDPVFTRADEQRMGLDRPYLCCYDPRQVFNWSVDSYGNLEWIVIKTVESRQESPTAPLKHSANWYLFDRSTFRHYRYIAPDEVTDSGMFFANSDQTKDNSANATLVDEGPHSLAAEGRVPVRVCELPMSLWFTNRAYLHLLEHFDQKNGYSWKLFMCAHPQLVIQTEDEINGQTLSEVGYLKLAPADKIFWLEPDGNSLKESREHTEGLRQEIYRDFSLQAQGRPSTATADGASGYSKEMEVAPMNDMLNDLGDVTRASMQLLLIDYKAAAGLPMESEQDKPDVNGFRFETKPLLQDIGVAQALTDTGVTEKSPTLEKVVDVNIALAACDGQNEETKQQIVKEIESAPTRKEQAQIDQQNQMQMQQQQFEQQLNTRLMRTGAADIAKQESEAVAA